MKFLQFNFELDNIKEDVLTDEFVEKLNDDFKNKQGIYEYCNIEIGVWEKSNNLALTGTVKASTKRECTEILGYIKRNASKTFNIRLKDVIPKMIMRGDTL